MVLRPLHRAAAATALLTLSACATEPEAPVRPLHYDLSAVHLDASAMRDAVNAYRARHGLPALRSDPALAAMAQRQASAMAAADELSHTVAGPFSRRLDEAGVHTWKAGENVGAGYFSQDAMLAGWKASPGHDANLLLSDASRFGVALAKAPGTRYGAFWAMEVAADPRPETGALAATGPDAGPAGLFAPAGADR